MLVTKPQGIMSFTRRNTSRKERILLRMNRLIPSTRIGKNSIRTERLSGLYKHRSAFWKKTIEMGPLFLVASKMRKSLLQLSSIFTWNSTIVYSSRSTQNRSNRSTKEMFCTNRTNNNCKEYLNTQWAKTSGSRWKCCSRKTKSASKTCNQWCKCSVPHYWSWN